MSQSTIDAAGLRSTLLRRLELVRERVRHAEISRVAGGDLIAEEVCGPAGALEGKDRAFVLFEAELMRARLYQESDTATPLEAAEALFKAASAEKQLPEKRRDPATMMSLAWRIGQDLVPINSRRNRFAVMTLFFQSALACRARDRSVLQALEEAPSVLESAIPAGVQFRPFLVSVARILRDRRIEAPGVRERLRQLALRVGAPEVAATLLLSDAPQGVEAAAEVARALVRGRDPRRVARHLEALIKGHEGLVSLLLDDLRELAVVAGGCPPERAAELARLFGTCSLELVDSAWSCLGYARALAASGEFTKALAATARALELGAALHEVGPEVGSAARLSGFEASANAMDAGRPDASSEGAASRTLRAVTLARAGRLDEAREILDGLVMRSRPQLALWSAWAAARDRDPRRARESLAKAPLGASLEKQILARVFEAEGRLDQALDAWEASLAEGEVGAQERRLALDAIEAELRAYNLKGPGRRWVESLAEPGSVEHLADEGVLRVRAHAARLAARAGEHERQERHLGPLSAHTATSLEETLQQAEGLRLANDLQGARALLLRSWRRGMREVDLRLHLAAVALRGARYGVARRHLRRAAASGDPRATLSLAAMEARAHGWSSVVELLGDLPEAMTPSQRAEGLWMRGCARMELSGPEAGLQDLVESIARKRTPQRVHELLEVATAAATRDPLGSRHHLKRLVDLLGGDTLPRALSQMVGLRAELESGASPRRAQEVVSRLATEVPELAELPEVEALQERLRELGQEASLPLCVEWIRREEAHGVSQRTLKALQQLSSGGDEAATLHLALALHRRALELDLAEVREDEVFDAFERAHRAWSEVFAFKTWPAGEKPQLAERRRLEKELAVHHVHRAAACADESPDRAALHIRLAAETPLGLYERAQRRCDLSLRLLEGLKMEDPAHRATLRSRLALILQGDPSNPTALETTLAVESQTIADTISEALRVGAEGAAADEVEGAVLGASVAAESVRGDMELYASNDAEGWRRTGLWALGAAAVAAWQGDDARRLELARAALDQLAKGEAESKHLELARKLSGEHPVVPEVTAQFETNRMAVPATRIIDLSGRDPFQDEEERADPPTRIVSPDSAEIEEAPAAEAPAEVESRDAAPEDFPATRMVPVSEVDLAEDDPIAEAETPRSEQPVIPAAAEEARAEELVEAPPSEVVSDEPSPIEPSPAEAPQPPEAQAPAAIREEPSAEVAPAPPASWSGTLELAQAALDEGRMSAAEGLAREAIALAQKAGESQGLRAGVELMQTIRSADSSSRWGRQQAMIEEALRRRRFREAWDLLTGAAQDPTIPAEAGLLRVRALLGLGRGQAARRELVECSRIATRSAPIAETLVPLYREVLVATADVEGDGAQRAMAALDEGEGDRALAILNQLGSEDPELRWLRAQALRAAGFPDEARMASREAMLQARARGDSLLLAVCQMESFDS